MRRIEVLDTTLRDGEQAPGCSMKLGDKLEVAKQLERMKVDVIEAGFPIASPDDFAAVREVARLVRGCGVAALCRATEGDIARAWEAIRDAARPRINIFLATSDIHLEHKLRMSRDQLLEAAGAAVRYARSLCGEVQFSVEDATRSDPDFLLQVLRRVKAEGALLVNLCDTVGYMDPAETAELVRLVREGLEGMPVGIHCHNDLGMAVANTLAGVRAGAEHVECTINGIGERAGMAALEEVAMALKTRRDYYGADTGLATREFNRASKLLASLIDFPIPPNKAIVGDNAFVHEAGVHQHGVLSNPLTYEIMRPEDVGVNVDRMVMGKHSGKAAFRERLETLGYHLEKKELEEAFVRFKILADGKKEVTDDDLRRLAEGETAVREAYRLGSFVVNSGTLLTATAVVRLWHGGREYEHVARGETPTIAAFNAIDKIVKHSYPLHAFHINSVSEGRAELGESVVQIRDGDRILTGRGIDTDIVSASIKAYLSAINKALASQSWE